MFYIANKDSLAKSTVLFKGGQENDIVYIRQLNYSQTPKIRTFPIHAKDYVIKYKNIIKLSDYNTY